MAGDVAVRTSAVAPSDVIAAVERVFVDVERECTRFDPASSLMLANRAGSSWCQVGPRCFAALREAADAHECTSGRFDPRVLSDLLALGYDRTQPFGRGRMVLAPGVTVRGRSESSWRPRFDDEHQAVQVGDRPVDLGGIAKGLAVRWAAEAVGPIDGGLLIEAGGDCWLGGDGPSPPGWQVGIENPLTPGRPAAVLGLRDLACATSSMATRNWMVAGRPAHHLIDPATGKPGGMGLVSVTVVAADPAWAEVVAKVLFLSGRDGIAALSRAVPALWITDDQHVAFSSAIEPYLLWDAR